MDRWVIRVDGRLDEVWAEELVEGSMEHLPDGTTRLAGSFADQSELVGFLLRMAGLGVKRRSIFRKNGGDDPNSGSIRQESR
jgi:hypothetical protein